MSSGQCAPENSCSDERTARRLIYSNDQATFEATQPRPLAALCPTTAEIVRQTTLGPVSCFLGHRIKTLIAD